MFKTLTKRLDYRNRFLDGLPAQSCTIEICPTGEPVATLTGQWMPERKHSQLGYVEVPMGKLRRLYRAYTDRDGDFVHYRLPDDKRVITEVKNEKRGELR